MITDVLLAYPMRSTGRTSRLLPLCRYGRARTRTDAHGRYSTGADRAHRLLGGPHWDPCVVPPTTPRSGSPTRRPPWSRRAAITVASPATTCPCRPPARSAYLDREPSGVVPQRVPSGPTSTSSSWVVRSSRHRWIRRRVAGSGPAVRSPRRCGTCGSCSSAPCWTGTWSPATTQDRPSGTHGHPVTSVAGPAHHSPTTAGAPDGITSGLPARMRRGSPISMVVSC